jgi:hypothetical protein
LASEEIFYDGIIKGGNMKNSIVLVIGFLLINNLALAGFCSQNYNQYPWYLDKCKTQNSKIANECCQQHYEDGSKAFCYDENSQERVKKPKDKSCASLGKIMICGLPTCGGSPLFSQ